MEKASRQSSKNREMRVVNKSYVLGCSKMFRCKARKKPIRVELSRKPVLILSPPSPVYINNGLTAYSRLIEDIPASF
jgi:hypothetical protein